MRIVLTTMMYKRYDVFTLWAKNYQYLKNSLPEIDLMATCVGSDGNKGKELCDKYGIVYTNYKNSPLGEKANFRLELTQTLKPDYVVFLGSDDLISLSDMLYKISKIKDGYDWIAPMDIYYVDYHSRQERYSNGYNGTRRQGEPMAVGRCLSYDVLDRLKWKLFNPNKNRGLDGSAQSKLKRMNLNKHFYYHKAQGTCVMDVKSSHNLNSFIKIIRTSTQSQGMFVKHFNHLL